jgi:hypothetical protein
MALLLLPFLPLLLSNQLPHNNAPLTHGLLDVSSYHLPLFSINLVSFNLPPLLLLLFHVTVMLFLLLQPLLATSISLVVSFVKSLVMTYMSFLLVKTLLSSSKPEVKLPLLV